MPPLKNDEKGHKQTELLNFTKNQEKEKDVNSKCITYCNKVNQEDASFTIKFTTFNCKFGNFAFKGLQQ